MICRLIALAAVLGSACSLPQGRPDYDYIYDDYVATPDFQQPIPQAPIVQPRSRQPSQAPAPPQQRPSSARQAASQASDAGVPSEDISNTTHVPILKDSRRTDPITGAFIYDYMGGDGSGKYEIRYLNGTVIGNYTYINDLGEREVRWYSAGTRGTENSGDGNFATGNQILVDETTGANYVDLSNYELYRHLEVPYVHIAGPSDPDEHGQLSSPDRQRNRDNQAQQPRQQQQTRQQQQPRQQFIEAQQPSQIPLDAGDAAHFASTQQRQAAPLESSRTSNRQAPSRISRTRTPVQAAPRSNAPFDPRAIDNSSPNHVLDSIISQFQ